jgi:hypothetical protein
MDEAGRRRAIYMEVGRYACKDAGGRTASGTGGRGQRREHDCRDEGGTSLGMDEVGRRRATHMDVGR